MEDRTSQRFGGRVDIWMPTYSKALNFGIQNAKIVILDAARQNPFAGGNQPLAGGLALVEPMPSMAIAFNAAPGTVAPDEQGPYGAYATSLTEMIAAGGLGLDEHLHDRWQRGGPDGELHRHAP